MGGAMHSRARTSGVVIRVPSRMINEAFWGPRKFLFCRGPQDQGQGLGAFPRVWKGVHAGLVSHFAVFVPSRSSHDQGVSPSELGFWYLEQRDGQG